MSDTSPLSRAYTIATAGLLHDIGKFLQRSGKKLLKADDYNYAYGTKHGYGHVHAAFTGLFFDGKFTFGSADNQEIKASYDGVLQAFPSVVQHDKETSMANLAASHHKVGDQSHPLQWIIAEADRLASGFERDRSEEQYNAYAQALAKEEQKSKHSNTHMRNIFADIKLSAKEDQQPSDDNSNKPTEKALHYPFAPLEPSILPINNSTVEESQAAKDYTRLLTGFAEGLTAIARRVGANKNDKSSSLANAYLALASLMERYCWSIPSATVSYENGKFTPTPTNISLYDHSRATSAIATALYAWHREKDDIDHAKAGNLTLISSVKDRSKEQKFCFIQGDFSGIQHFIFDAGGESNKFAAKILRAKSFYVSMATEAAAHAICHELNLPLSSIIMNAGGKFTILAANTSDLQAAVGRVKTTINEHFHKLTFGQTRFNIATLCFQPERLVMREYALLMGDLAHALECEKLRPQISEPVFKEYLSSRKSRELCTICGKHWGDETKYGTICPHCNRFRRLGEALVSEEVKDGEARRNYFHIQYSEDQKEGDWTYPLFGQWHLAFGKSPDLSAPTYNIDRQSTFSGFAHKHLANYVPRWRNDGEWDELRYKGISKERLEGIELNVNATKTFAHIGADALHEEENGKLRGVAHLGVLKADVDHLGQIFSRGFTVKENGKDISYANMSRMSMLSRMLDYFFTGWLPWRLAKKPAEGEVDYRSVYTVFAGGDDLFLIGPWNRIVDLAGEIDQHLRQYTGGNPDIHLSAGIVLRKAAIPVREMARDAEEALDAAKHGEGPEAGKNRNRITVFGQTVTWEEYKELMRSGDALKQRTQTMESELSTQYLYGLLKFSQDAATATTFPESPEEVNAWMEAAKWRARLKYRHQRYFVEKSKKEETKLEAMEFVFKDIQEKPVK